MAGRLEASATEAVADAADGFDEGAVLADFFAEHVDVLVEGAGVGEVFHAPAAVEELVAGDGKAALFL